MNTTPAPKKTAPRILRLDWLEKQAQTYRELGEARGNTARISRAVSLELAADSQSMAIVMYDVTAYVDAG